MIERRRMSVSQFADLCAFEPERFVGVEVNRHASTVTVLLEGDENAEREAVPTRTQRKRRRKVFKLD